MTKNKQIIIVSAVTNQLKNIKNTPTKLDKTPQNKIIWFINKKTIEGNVYFNNNQLSVDSINYMNDHIILNNLSFKEGVISDL